MAREPQVSLRPICILNSKSVHVQSAMGHIARISGAFGAEAQVVVTKRGDDVSSLAARALNDRRRPVVAGGAALAELRKAFDRANQKAADALKGAGSGKAARSG